jgi:TrkA domain protein
MAEIQETLLPGVGVRHELTTSGGERLALLTHRTGRRELAIYDRDDPDVCRTVLHLSGSDTSALSELLGASQVSETVRQVQRLEGVAIEWITVAPTSAAAGRSIAAGEYRTQTGASIVAIIRGDSTVPPPGPDTLLTGGDVVVAVGTPEGLDRLRSSLGS